MTAPDYKKAYKVIEASYRKQMINDLKKEGLPDMLIDMANELAFDAVLTDPNRLFEHFDKQGIYIQILVVYGTSVWFTFTVNDSMDNPNFSTRKEAEEAAILEAYKQLDEKLDA
jgi:hypothetical protein